MFYLVDVCRVLDLSNPTRVKSRIEDDLTTSAVIYDSLGRLQNATFINEDALYDVIFDSRKPEARAFRKWVTSDVLPTLRKTGEYRLSSHRPATYAEALRQLADEVEQRERPSSYWNKRQSSLTNLRSGTPSSVMPRSME